MLRSPSRNKHVITESGLEVLAKSPGKIDNLTLVAFEGFQDWIAKPKGDAAGDAAFMAPAAPAFTTAAQSPEDAMAVAQSILDAALRDELLLILKDISPVRFERLILDLLSAMGYGGGDLSGALMTRTSGDGGIDGIIHEDALGLDAVYIQAKRYAPENKVGRPAIQQFVGSLNGEGATKGVFVTTSDFSKEARDYLNKVQHRIVLIDGQELARLMIRYGVGVRARTTYVIKGVDEDYFADLNAG